MKQVCLHCSRQAPVGNLWCQEAYCAVDDKPILLDPGESLGEVEILRLVTVQRTAAVYEAQRARQPLLLKVAHDGMQERLKREAAFLLELRRRKVHHPALPILLPAYDQADLASYPYGKAVLRGQTFYYTVLDNLPGETLRDFLQRNPQPWYRHAAWLILAVSDAVALMHSAQRLHLCLSPECILVRNDMQGIPRPLLVDLGTVTRPEDFERNWERSFVPPAYLAPELLSETGSRFGAFTDVYGLGLLFYEMLAGHPAYDARLRSEAEVYQEILNQTPPTLERADLRNLPQIAEKAISRDYRIRSQNIIALAKEIQANLPSVPREKQPRRVNWRTVAVVLSAAMAITLLLVLALSLTASLG